jgi:hypothetical protein
MTLFRACLAALLLFPQEAGVAELLSRLDDDAIETRTDAARQLVRLGKAALPEIQKALEAAGGERRERLAGIARRIGELDRLSVLLRPPSRITLDAKERPLREVLESLAKQADAELDLEDVPDGEKVTVACRALPFWEALDQVCRASGKVMYEIETEKVLLRAEPYAALPRRFVGGFAVLLSSIEISSSGSFGETERSDAMNVHVEVGWERGTRPTFVRVQFAGLTDDAGKDLLPPAEELPSEFQVAVGPGQRVATAVLTTGLLPDPKARKLARVRLEVDCGFVLRYGGVAFAEPGARGPQALECPQYAATLVSCRKEDGAFLATLKVEPRGEAATVGPEAFVLKLDDGSAPAAQMREISSDGVSHTYTLTWPMDGKRTPKELAVRTPVETHEERITAEFKDVPLE